MKKELNALLLQCTCAGCSKCKEKWDKQEQRKRVIFSDQITVQKGYQYVQYIHVQKSYFTRSYEKK